MAVTSRTRRGTSTRAAKVTGLAQGKLVIPMGDYDPESDRQYAGDQPVAGNYTFRLTSVNYHESESSGNASIKWVFRIDDPRSPYNGWPYGEQYTNLDSALFKTQRIVYALTGSTDSPELDLSDTKAGEKSRQKFIDAAKLVRGSVRIDADYNPDEPRAKLQNIMPLDAAAMAAAADDDEDDYDDDDDEIGDEYEDDEEDVDDDEADEDDDADEEDDDDEDEYEEDDEDDAEEEPAPAPVKRARKAAAPARAAKAAPATRAAKKAAPARRARR